MYRRILVPLDGSELAENVLRFVRVLAKPEGSEISLLRVVEHTAPDISPALNPVLYADRTLENRLRQAHEYLTALANGLKAEGFVVTTTTREGRPAKIILEKSKLEPDTLIAMSTHGRTGFVRWWLGSVADEVLHNTDGPLLLVGPGVAKSVTGETKLEKAIVALDGSALAEAVLPHAATVAEALGLEIDLVKVTPAEGLLYYENGPEMVQENGEDSGEHGEVKEQSAEELDARAADYLEEVADGLRGLGAPLVMNHVVHGAPPSEALAAHAQDFGHALMAVATHGRAGLARGLMGSVADDLIRLSPHPVLVLRVADAKAGAETSKSGASSA